MDEKLPEVHEPNAIFRSISDLTVFQVVNKDTDKTLVEISGYDLQISFNMEFINSLADVETAAKGMSDLFRDIILERLLAEKRQSNEAEEEEGR